MTKTRMVSLWSQLAAPDTQARPANRFEGCEHHPSDGIAAFLQQEGRVLATGCPGGDLSQFLLPSSDADSEDYAEDEHSLELLELSGPFEVEAEPLLPVASQRVTPRTPFVGWPERIILLGVAAALAFLAVLLLL